MNLTILLLSVLSMSLMIAEVFVPGLIVGSLGVVSLVIATVLTHQEYGFAWALTLFFGVGGVSFLVFILFFKSAASRFLILNQTLPGKSSEDHSALMGLQGVSITDLRPAGKGQFQVAGKRTTLDIVTTGEFLDKDQEIKILRVEGSRIFVAAAQDPRKE